MASNDNQRLLEELEALDEAGTLEGLNPDLVGVTTNLLHAIGEDPAREGLVHTPVRVAKAWHHLTRGYRTNIDELINDAVFSEDYDEMVTVKNIRFYSLCEHHLLPFWGSCSVAYIPNGKVIGLSKIPRIVDMFSRRLQIQERLCQQIAQTLDDTLNPKGVAVVMEGFHMCMMMRGVEKEDSRTTTSAMRGVFKDNPQTRNEFLDIVRMRLAN